MGGVVGVGLDSPGIESRLESFIRAVQTDSEVHTVGIESLPGGADHPPLLVPRLQMYLLHSVPAYASWGDLYLYRSV